MTLRSIRLRAHLRGERFSWAKMRKGRICHASGQHATGTQGHAGIARDPAREGAACERAISIFATLPAPIWGHATGCL